MVTTEGHAPCSAAQLQSPTPPHLCLLTPHRCRYPPRVQPTLLPVLGYLRPCWPRSLLAPRATRRPVCARMVWARMVWARMAWASMAWACPRRASRVSWTMMMARRGPARRPQLQPRQGPFPERPAPGRPPRGLWQQQRLWQQQLPPPQQLLPPPQQQLPPPPQQLPPPQQQLPPPQQQLPPPQQQLSPPPYQRRHVQPRAPTS